MTLIASDISRGDRQTIVDADASQEIDDGQTIVTDDAQSVINPDAQTVAVEPA